MRSLSTLIALTSTYIRQEHLRTLAGRSRALKALSAPLRSPRASLRWVMFLYRNKLARKLLRGNPHFAVRPLLKYLNSNYQFQDRVRTIVSHYEFVARQFSEMQLEAMYFGAGLSLAAFTGKSGTIYRVVLGTYSPRHPEGEMLLKIETSRGEVICFATFSIGCSEQKLRIELGALQGARRNVSPDITKIATRDFHSTRPKHLLMALLSRFAGNYDIPLLVCISKKAHMDRSNVCFYADYDGFWQELGGQELVGSGFYSISLDHVVPARASSKHQSRHQRRASLKSDIAKMLLK